MNHDVPDRPTDPPEPVEDDDGERADSGYDLARQRETDDEAEGVRLVTYREYIDLICGHIELKQITKHVGDTMETYGYSIHYDRYGVKVKETEPTLLSVLHFNGVSRKSLGLRS